LDHARVLSEPLCLALLAATLALMVFSKRPLLYGVAAAAAGLVRYAAVPAGGAAVLWAFGLHGSLRERVRRAALAALPTALLSAAVMLRSLLESGGARGIGLHADLGPTLREAGVTVVAWLAPLVPPRFGGVLLAAMVAGAGIALLLDAASGRPGRPEPTSPARSLLLAAGLLAACYAAFVLASRLFVFDSIPFDDRMLSPVIFLADIAAVAALGSCWRAWARPLRLVAVTCTVLWLTASGFATVRAIEDARDGGWGYAGDAWRGSRLAAWLRAEGRGFEIFSNDPAAVYFATHRASHELPTDATQDVVTEFDHALHARRSLIVGFSTDYDRMIAPDSLAGLLGLRKVAAFPDGAVWVSEPLSPAQLKGSLQQH